ncbi:MAG: carbohydrate binding domain-containing protein [Planctomycetes bacterium]|nr:carbohydrate binding domain-containing protein [Planctomycetota bacterium]
MPRPTHVALALLTSAATCIAAVSDDERPFPFAVAWDEAGPSVIDSSAMVPAPLSGGPLQVKDGHLADDQGRRVRLLGVNFCAGANFPEPAEAPAIARRLRRLGVSCVRLHHMDSHWAKPNLFGLDGGIAERPAPESLARLDALIAALAEQGIRVNLNLHVARIYGPELGLPKAPAGTGAASHGKVVGYFEERAIALQRQFARDLLDRVNPLRGRRLAEDPVLAMVELVNEDSLLGDAGQLAELPDPWKSQITRRWNDWLAQRHASTDALRAHWNDGVKPAGPELLGDGRFASMGGWVVERHAPAEIESALEDPAGATDRPAGRMLRVSPRTLDGTSWHLQVHRKDITLVPGETYTLSFAARSAAPRKLSLSARQDQAPYGVIGLSAGARLDTAWRRFSYTFVASAAAGPGSRLSFAAGDNATEYFLADVALRSGGGGIELSAEQRLEDRSIPLVELGASAPGRDFAAFLIATEDAFCQGMRRFIREDLRCPAPVLASQASYGGIGGLLRESRLDMVDMHAYWQHPSFPRRSWDVNDFRIENTPMSSTSDGGALLRVAQFRAAGKPFTVTEYDHPAPSEYAAEAVPLAFAVAARQDWDGIFLFDYLSSTGPAVKEPRITSFFSCAQHPAKLAFLPIAAEMFLAGAMPATDGVQRLDFPAAGVADAAAERVGNGFWRAAGATGENLDLIGQRIEVAFADVPAARIDSPPPRKY